MKTERHAEFLSLVCKSYWNDVQSWGFLLSKELKLTLCVSLTLEISKTKTSKTAFKTWLWKSLGKNNCSQLSSTISEVIVWNQMELIQTYTSNKTELAFLGAHYLTWYKFVHLAPTKLYLSPKEAGGGGNPPSKNQAQNDLPVHAVEEWLLTRVQCNWGWGGEERRRLRSFSGCCRVWGNVSSVRCTNTIHKLNLDFK